MTSMTESSESSESSYSNVVSFTFNEATARKYMIKMVILRDLPFQLLQDPCFQQLVNYLNPNFVNFSRDDISNEMIRLYNEEKENIKKILLDCPGKISLTSEVWESSQGLNYLSITAHFIDKDWVLQKRVIIYFLIDKTLKIKEIALEIFGKLANDWGISRKIFSITVDKCSANFPLRGDFFRVGCCGEILNLVVQHGLEVEEFKVTLERIRGNFEHILVSPPRYLKFMELCKTHGLKPKRLLLDVEDRWNSTYIMLNDAIVYRLAITDSYNSGACPHRLTDDDWKYAKFLCDFLRPSHDATKFFSSVGHVKIPAVLKYLFEIGEIFSNYRTDSLFKGIVHAIEQKFVEYWGQTPMLVGLASILDPRVKTKGLENALSELDRLFDDSASMVLCSKVQSTSIDSKLKSLLLEHYENKNKPMHASASTSSSSLSPVLPAGSTGPSRKRSFWDVIRHDRSSRDPLETTLEELNKYYLELEPNDEEYENFDVLSWWKRNEKRYPILSAIARDILSVPVSTVPSEMAFVTSKRKLNDYRSSLTPDMLERCMVLKGCWEAEPGHLVEIDPLNEDTGSTEDIVRDLSALNTGYVGPIKEAMDL